MWIISTGWRQVLICTTVGFNLQHGLLFCIRRGNERAYVSPGELNVSVPYLHILQHRNGADLFARAFLLLLGTGEPKI